MTIAITNTAQLDMFSLVRSALLANSALSAKFDVNNIYEFDPKEKSSSFRGFPYIFVDTSPTSTERYLIDNATTEKTFGATLYLRMEYHAKDNFKSYANAIIRAVESYESSFQSSGYYDVEIDLIDIDSNAVIHQKELIEGVFEIRWRGRVMR